MIDAIKNYYHWLHGKWPAGKVEKLPVVGQDGVTNVNGIRVTGDLTGIPLLKMSSDSGAKAVMAMAKELESEKSKGGDDFVDIAIIGAGVSGASAAMEATKNGLSYKLFEASEMFSTVVNFPKKKPIFTYPTDMTPAGGIQYGEKSDVKESLLEDMREQVASADVEITNARIEKIEGKAGNFTLKDGDGNVQTKARRVVVAIGRSGNFRSLGVPGEDLDKVSNRLFDPKEFCQKKVLVVGGGDSAMEAAIALANCGSDVILSYRRKEFSRPKPENAEKVKQLSENPDAPVGVDSPTSDRVGSTSSPEMRGDAPAGKLTLALHTDVLRIEDDKIVLKDKETDEEATYENDQVFAMIGREAPLDFFRRNGVTVAGDRNGKWWGTFIFALLVATFVYHWKKGGTPLPINEAFVANNWFPFNLWDAWGGLGAAFRDPSTLLGTLRLSVADPGFYYSLLYCGLMLTFGIRRIKRRKTPYVTKQTATLVAIQIIPLFFLPYIVLPWMGHNGAFGDRSTLTWIDGEEKAQWAEIAEALPKPNEELPEGQSLPELPQSLLPEASADWGEPTLAPGWGVTRVSWQDGQQTLAVDSKLGVLFLTDQTASNRDLGLFPPAEYGHGREYWRAFGFILAWPLFLWNMFTEQPLWTWLIISVVQTFVIIPLIIWRWGKGAYCGWICSCGGMAETLGDTHRHKMPHGPQATRWNMVGQVFLAMALLLLIFRFITWIPGLEFLGGIYKIPESFYGYFVDLIWAGIIGFGVYFHLSGRVWCRFACPLAALMHIYARFSRFRIFPEKSKCISCNVCTSVCHQGIDIMSFANKGEPMQDPECVRCSACVQECPTGVLSFGRLDNEGSILKDRLAASPVQMREEAEKS